MEAVLRGMLDKGISAGHISPGTNDSRFDKAISALRKAGAPESALTSTPLGTCVEE
jgi:hypothetical protein